MAKRDWQARGFDFINNLWANLACAGVCMMLSVLYTHLGPVWSRPIVNGLVTGVVVLGLLTAIRAILSLPSAHPRITPENIQNTVIMWLHNFGLTVTMYPGDDTCHFFIKVTTESGKNIGVYRKKGTLDNYLTFQSGVTQQQAGKEALESFTDEEKLRTILTLKLEMARSVLGYSTKNMLEEYSMWRQIPITESLSEAQVINTVWEIEAAVTAMNTLEAIASMEHTAKEESKSEKRISRRARSPETI